MHIKQKEILPAYISKQKQLILVMIANAEKEGRWYFLAAKELLLRITSKNGWCLLFKLS